jgi:molybdenum cofactor cytidylyltransferase
LIVTGAVSAILLAAGESRRMGQPKLILPWGDTTVLGKVVTTFVAAGLEDILVVTGGAYAQVGQLVTQLAKMYPVRSIQNPEYADGGMLSSIQTGLAELGADVRAALIGLGDQPQVREETIRCICKTFTMTDSPLVIPSFQDRRGHPWLVARSLWPEFLALPITSTPREFLGKHARQIAYVPADESTLKDLDTQEEYFRQRPRTPDG